MGQATRLNYYATDEDRAALEALAKLRFAGNRAAAIRWAVELAALVAADPATYGAGEPARALAAYVAERCPDRKT